MFRNHCTVILIKIAPSFLKLQYNGFLLGIVMATYLILGKLDGSMLYYNKDTYLYVGSNYLDIICSKKTALIQYKPFDENL